MAIPLVLMAAGTAMSMIGQMSANMSQAQAELQNQKFYDDQARFAQLSAQRAESLAEIDYTTKYGAQLSAYASGGIDISGSAALTVGGTVRQALDEIWAIKEKGTLEMKLARMRGNQSGERAATLSSAGYNAVQAGTTALSAYTKSEGFGQGFPSFMYGGTPPSSGSGSYAKYFPGREK